MDRITSTGAVDIGGGRSGFRDRNLAAGTPGTVVNAEFLNAVQEELLALVTTGGITPSRINNAQLLAALRAMFGSTGTLAENGYMRLSGGILLQWGRGTSAGSTTSVLFPTIYPTRPTSVVLSEQNANGWGNPPQPTIYGANAADRAGFSAYAARIQGNGVPVYQAGLAFNWMAIGY